MIRLIIFVLIACSFICSSILGQVNLHHKADSLAELEKFEAANHILDLLQHKYFGEENFNEYLNTNLAIAKNLDYLGLPDSAIFIIIQTIDLSTKQSVNDSLLAISYHQIANIQYSSLKEDNKAINNWKKAINIRRDIFPNNHLDIIKSHKNIGNAYVNLQKLQEGKTSLQTALDLHLTRVQKDSFLIARTYKDLGWVLTLLEDYNNAGKYLNVALEIYKDLFFEEPWILSEVYEDMVYYFSNREAYVEMINQQKEILERYSVIEEKLEDDYIAIANIYSNLGLGYDLMDSLNQALKYYIESLQINQKYVTDNSSALALNYKSLSNIYTKQNDFKAAVKAINKAIKLDRKIDNKIGLASNLNDKAHILLKKESLTKALNTINTAIEIIKSPNNELILDKALLIFLLNKKLLIQKRLGKKDTKYLQLAVQTIHRIIKFTNQLRTDYQSDASKSFLAKKAKTTFENAIELYLALYKNTQDKKYLADAFQIAEQAKSIILMDAVQQAQAKNTVEVPTELLDNKTPNCAKRKSFIFKRSG